MVNPLIDDGLHGSRRYLAIAVVSLGTILTALDSNIVNIRPSDHLTRVSDYVWGARC